MLFEQPSQFFCYQRYLFRGGDSNEKGYQTDDARQVITRNHMAFG
jgi:hypothetical protein